MKWHNRVQLIGYLGKDPVIGQNQKEQHFVLFRLATSKDYTKPDQERENFWHRIRFWTSQPDVIRNQFIKGSHVLVEGQLTYREYLAKDQTTHVLAEIKAHQVMNLDR